MGKLCSLKAEGFLRLFSLTFSVLCSCLVGFDAQTKQVLLVTKRATDKDISALSALVVIEAVAAGYSLVQLCKCVILGNKQSSGGDGCGKTLAWVCFLLDQAMAYGSFAATSAATQASVLAITGVSDLQWSKLCNTYTRFCEQVGGGLVCGFLGSFFMAVVSAVSAFHLFTRYSSKCFMVLKTSRL